MIEIVILIIFLGLILLAIINRIMKVELGKKYPKATLFISKINYFLGLIILVLLVLSILFVVFLLTPEIDSRRTSNLFVNK